MDLKYDMTNIERVVNDYTPKELSEALQAILFDACIYYMDPTTNGFPGRIDCDRVSMVRLILEALQETHEK